MQIMNLEELRRQRAQKLQRAKMLQDELDNKDSDLTPEQREKRGKECDTLLQESKDLQQTIDQMVQSQQSAEDRRKQINEAMTELGQSAGRRTPPGGGEQLPNAKVNEPNFTKDPMKGFASPRDYFMGVMRENPQTPKDERLQYLSGFRLAQAAGSDEHKVADDASLGFLVPEGMSPDLLTTGSDRNPLAGQLRNVPMDSPSIKVNYRLDKNHTSSVSGGLSVSRSAETASKAASQMKVGRLRMEASSLFGFAYATEELLADSPRSVAALIAEGFGDEFQSVQFSELLRGTGVAEPLGFLNANNGSLITVNKETGQTAATINYLNIIKMRARCWMYSQATWLYNHDCLPQLMQLVMPIGTGGVAMWQFNAREDGADTLLGRPAVATEYMETVGAKGDIALVVPKEILSGNYQPLESAESIHVRFDRHERAFKFWLRNDQRPWWEDALTPKKGADTLSPFVTLAARA
jgi:HK97 family phage major capsid protein